MLLLRNRPSRYRPCLPAAWRYRREWALVYWRTELFSIFILPLWQKTIPKLAVLRMDEWLDLPDLIDKTHELIELGLFNQAAELLAKYESVYANDIDIPVLYSRLYTETDQPEKALPWLYKGLNIDKNNPECLLGLFFVYTQLENSKKAIHYLLLAEHYHPHNEQVLNALIWYYNEKNCPEDAVRYFEKALNTGTDNPETFQHAGLSYQRLGRHEEARQCFESALAINPHFHEVRDFLADLHILRGNSTKSIELYRTYLEESPNNLRTMSRLVFCLCQCELFDQASDEARKTIRYYPNSPVGYVDLAYVHLNTGKFDEAFVAAQQALDVAPVDTEALRVLAIIQSERGEMKSADKAFQNALKIDGDNPEIMRDYYHHLKLCGNYTKMELVANRVIRMEYPYCMEDFWFLADFYRERGKNLKAFDNLRKAYKLMPQESELIPSIVEILVERKHFSYAAPFLLQYIKKNGWNEIMDQIGKARGFKNKWNRESLRLLRFFGQRPVEYRKFIFHYHVRRLLLFIVPVLLGLIVSLILFLRIP
ncbi:MAG: tetratricopeptide repeat protein [Chitinivibrionales bacterium]|nr:tetratricopeptide repeat protein [Chitinivibrionales bacterium]